MLTTRGQNPNEISVPVTITAHYKLNSRKEGLFYLIKSIFVRESVRILEFK